MRYLVGIIGLLVLVAAWMLGGFSGTDVRFQSSDGEWADSEILFKGRSFEMVLVRFELYRARCAPTAVLERATPEPSWWSFEHWFNNYGQPKWRVPYASPLPKTGSGYFPPVSAKHCANTGASAEEERAARERARRILGGSAA